MPELLDRNEIRSAIATLYAPGDVFEVRVLEARDRPNGRGMTWAGWFTGADAEAVADELERLRAWHGVYTTINPCDPLLLHRCPRRLEIAGSGTLTTDGQIARRAWLPLDFDPVIWGAGGVIKGIAAADSEKAAAIERAELVARELARADFPAPVRGDSGNGGWLLWRVDLPAGSDLPERFVRAVSRLWGDDPGSAKAGWNRSATVEVDKSIFNPARIGKLYGTLACKGAGIDDRPWRMARLIDVPFDGGELLSAETLQTWLEFVEEAAPPQAPASTSSAPPGAAQGPRPGPTGDFDALELARAQGLELADGKRRADGATFHEIVGPCPGCGRPRKAWISIAESGAVGLGCRTQSCAYSDSNGKPGDLWRTWRQEHDPSYSPDGQAAASRPSADERRAHTKAFADRFADDGPAVDVGAILGDGQAPQATPAPSSMARRRRDDGDDPRRRIVVIDDPRAIRDEVLEALADAPAVYVSQGRLATVADGRMVKLDGGALDSSIVDACRVVKPKRDRVTGELVDFPDQLPVRVRGMLENLEVLGRAAVARFRAVDQVTSTPFFTASGQLVDRAGYSAEARTLLVDPPELEAYPEPDGAACLAYLRELVDDFPFEGQAEISNLIGAMLVPMVRPMISGPVPMLIVEGNIPGIGKSYLASAIRILYGLQPEAGNLPKDEKLMASLMLGILMKSEPVHVFDDVTHSVISATLNRTITGRTYSDRILGVSDTASYVIRQLWIMTMNNAKVSADLVRRVFRCRLVWRGPGKPEDRRGFKHADFLAHVEAHRPAILSRLRQLVEEWIGAGRPMPADLPAMGSFESFALIIGGILRHAGDRAWLSNAAATKEAVAIDDDWPPFLAAWHADPQLGGTWGLAQRPAKLWDLANREGLLGSILGQGGNDSAQISRLSAALRSRRDSEIGGYRLLESRDDKTGMRLYRLEALAVVDATARPFALN